MNDIYRVRIARINYFCKTLWTFGVGRRRIVYNGLKLFSENFYNYNYENKIRD